MTSLTVTRNDDGGRDHIQYDILSKPTGKYLGWIGSNQGWNWRMKHNVDYVDEVTLSLIPAYIAFLKLIRLASMDWKGKKGSPTLERMIRK